MNGPPIDVTVRPPRRAARPAPGRPHGGDPRAVRQRDQDDAPAGPQGARSAGGFAEWWRWRGRTGVVVAAAAAAAGLLRHTGAAATPTGGDEGSIVATAWALGHSVPGDLRTFTTARSTLATWQLAAWDRVSGAFDRAPSAVAGGRAAVAIALVVTSALVWVLARRLGSPRWASAVAMVVAAVSPLATELYATVHPGALAAPWLAATFVLARSRTMSGRVGAGAGVTAAVAVLTNPVAVLTLPAAGWQVWRSARPSARRHAAIGFVCSVTACTAVGWGAFGLTSPLDLDAGLPTLGGRLVLGAGDIVGFDVLTAGVLAAAAVCAPLAARRFRPLALAFWTLCAAGALSAAPAVVALTCALPLGSVLLAGAVDALWTWTLDVRRARRQTRYNASRSVTVLDGLAPAGLLALAVLAAAGVPRWVDTQVTQRSEDAGTSLRDTVAWLDRNTADDTRLVVDDRLWLDVVLSGTEPSDVTTTGTLASAETYRYHVVQRGVGRPADAGRPVAVFGPDADRVEVLRIDDPQPAGPTAVDPGDAGAALADNPRLTIDPADAATLRAGQVDERVMSFLVTALIDHDVAVHRFPIERAEAAAEAPVRTVDIAAVDGRAVWADDPAVADLSSFLRRQDDRWYRPAVVEVTAGEGGIPVLHVAFPPL